MKSLRKRAVARSKNFKFKRLHNISIGECWLFYFNWVIICSKPLSENLFLEVANNPKVLNESKYKDYLHYTIKC